MVKCRVKIVEVFNLDYYPGWCRAVLTDVNGKEHVLVDKLPVIGLDIEEISELPMDTYICAELVNDYGNSVEIDTAIPDGIETEKGENHFVVSKEIIRMLN